MVCQLVETLGMFNMIVRVDLFLANNPLELKTFVQIYNLNDHVDFGDKIQYFIGRDFVERIHEFHVTHLIETNCAHKYIYTCIIHFHCTFH